MKSNVAIGLYVLGTFALLTIAWYGSTQNTASEEKVEMVAQKADHLNTIVNGVSFDVILVKGGTFDMDSNNGCGESQVYSVTLSDYYMGKHEVTQALWQAVMGRNPSSYKEANLPVEKVSWNDCRNFIKKLNRLTGKNFRLPTEAEWEFAALGGVKSQGYTYSGSNTLSEVGWHRDNSDSKTHAVGTKQANELGLYDMSGNIWEWCSDWYGSYGSGSQTNPTGSNSGSYRVIRGGSWFHDTDCCRVSFRDLNSPGNNNGSYLGLRLVLVP